MHQYRLQADWKYARQHLRKREKGVCQVCGANAVKLKGTLMKPWKQAVAIGRANRLHKNLYLFAEYKQLSLEYTAAAQALVVQGFHGFLLELPKSWRPRKGWKEPRDLWEADHIQAVVHGGTHEPTNLRTLCLPCHKKATKSLAESRRLTSAEAKPPPAKPNPLPKSATPKVARPKPKNPARSQKSAQG